MHFKYFGTSVSCLLHAVLLDNPQRLTDSPLHCFLPEKLRHRSDIITLSLHGEAVCRPVDQ